jgi:hypothetical protein
MIEKQKDGSIFVCADSPICEYCARKHYPDPDFDEDLCEFCYHRQGSYRSTFTCYEDNFLGIQCVTTDPRDD